MTPRDRGFDNYRYWSGRLEIIVEAYDKKSQPKALSQWLNDRRDKVQWYTFCLTTVFGLGQCITGILQVYFASRGH